MVIYFYSSGQEKKKKGKKGGKKSKNKKNKKDKKETEDQKKKRLQKEAEAKKKEEQRAEEKKKRDKFAAAKKAPKTPLHQEYMCKLYTSATPDQSKLGSNMNWTNFWFHLVLNRFLPQSCLWAQFIERIIPARPWRVQTTRSTKPLRSWRPSTACWNLRSHGHDDWSRIKTFVNRSLLKNMIKPFSNYLLVFSQIPGLMMRFNIVISYIMNM